ncbi:hypothetical protein LTR56_023127 [Elasticomyces elasticus]|nr:hypothetical protein LTR56_023127 [Elasticomyces elasticus]KAK3626667.1 hypothetical protein LTR22_023094 [Elasticomyces elasticus]KAK4916322.1 hypothetical protein LTR49_015695 [Elasticomyces elasticus]KAK5764918.1 hypothetical protein LTS12_004945 [Elasticomyces elasticus]
MSYGYGGYGDYGGYGGYENYGGYGDSGGYEDYGGYGGGMSQAQHQQQRRGQWNQYMMQQGMPPQMVQWVDQQAQDIGNQYVDDQMAYRGN